jgi:hypothetical protein
MQPTEFMPNVSKAKPLLMIRLPMLILLLLITTHALSVAR